MSWYWRPCTSSESLALNSVFFIILFFYWKETNLELCFRGQIGDYFGILMKERVTSFPFNTMNNPMYNGSTMVFLALSLWFAALSLFPFSFSRPHLSVLPRAGESAWPVSFWPWWCLLSTGSPSPTKGTYFTLRVSFLCSLTLLFFFFLQDPSPRRSTRSAIRRTRRMLERRETEGASRIQFWQIDEKSTSFFSFFFFFSFDLVDSAYNMNHTVENKGEPRFYFLLQSFWVCQKWTSLFVKLLLLSDNVLSSRFEGQAPLVSTFCESHRLGDCRRQPVEVSGNVQKEVRTRLF